MLEIGAQIIHVTPNRPSQINPHIPPELDRITLKALKKVARYQTAQELLRLARRSNDADRQRSTGFK